MPAQGSLTQVFKFPKANSGVSLHGAGQMHYVPIVHHPLQCVYECAQLTLKGVEEERNQLGIEMSVADEPELNVKDDKKGFTSGVCGLAGFIRN